MNNIISEYVAEQENLNKEMSVNDLNACIAKARMGEESVCPIRLAICALSPNSRELRRFDRLG